MRLALRTSRVASSAAARGRATTSSSSSSKKTCAPEAASRSSAKCLRLRTSTPSHRSSRRLRRWVRPAVRCEAKTHESTTTSSPGKRRTFFSQGSARQTGARSSKRSPHSERKYGSESGTNTIPPKMMYAGGCGGCIGTNGIGHASSNCQLWTAPSLSTSTPTQSPGHIRLETYGKAIRSLRRKSTVPPLPMVRPPTESRMSRSFSSCAAGAVGSTRFTSTPPAWAPRASRSARFSRACQAKPWCPKPA
mmetsp:Transcript_79574/g.233968  ORF Transcript_79574/g.233968 Transcript_79574/m.233968 type:complete len:249 (-) Transcript_79574:762-1508(-)